MCNEERLSEQQRIEEIHSLRKEYYQPSDSKEYYDDEKDQFYNRRGDELRHPSEFCQTNEGYTPFGDE